MVFMCLQYKSSENTVGKGEIAHKEQFLLFPQCFPPIWRTFCHFHQIEIVVCKLFQFGSVQNIVVWESVTTPVKSFNSLPHMSILGSSSSAANKNMMSKIWTNGDTII